LLQRALRILEGRTPVRRNVCTSCIKANKVRRAVQERNRASAQPVGRGGAAVRGSGLHHCLAGKVCVYTRIVLSDEDFIGCLAGNLRAAARVTTRLYDARLAGSGLRIGQVALLGQLRRHGPLSSSQLAELLSIERSTAVRDVQVLERRGLVAGQPDTTDRRSRQLSLTAQGEQRLAAAAPAWRSAQERMRSRLGGQEMTELVTLAQLVVVRSDAERPEAMGVEDQATP
jgi:DNA-binding MarR family transcriptional regulator